MSVLLYCYGPFSIEKNNFCNNFAEENKEYKLIQAHLIRKKITGTIIATDKLAELEVGKILKNECLKILSSNKKQNNVLINGLFLNKESRLAISQLVTLDECNKYKIKKAAIAFIEKDLTQCFEDIKAKKNLKGISFDLLKSQFLNFKMASTQEEADILINNIEEYGGRLNLDTKLWGKDIIIACDSLKKVAEYIKYTNSFH